MAIFGEPSLHYRDSLPFLMLIKNFMGALRHVPIALRETEEITEMYH